MIIALASLTPLCQKNLLAHCGYLDVGFCIQIMDDGADGYGEIDIRTVFAVAVLDASAFAAVRIGIFCIAKARKSADISDAMAVHAASVSSRGPGRPEFFEVFIESNRTVAAVAGDNRYSYIIDKHRMASIPHFIHPGYVSVVYLRCTKLNCFLRMKRFLGVCTVVACALAPGLAYASVFATGQEYSVGSQKRIDGNLYVASGNISVGAPVNGDVLVVGGNITTTGRVRDDVAAAGGTVQILAPVDGDVRVGGGQVTVGDRVGGDLIAAGGTIHILSESSVQGDLYVAGGQVIIDGAVRGSVRMMGGRLTINGSVGGDVRARADRDLVLGSGSSIGGMLSYRSQRPATIASDAVIAGGVAYEPIRSISGVREVPRGLFWALVGAVTAMKTLALFGMVALIVWRWRRQATQVLQEVKEALWGSVGKGLLYGILTPVAVVVLMMSFIGIIPGALILLAYLATMILAKVLAGILLGAWLSGVIYKHQALHVTWANALLGTLLIQVIGIVPFAGWLVQSVACLAVFGLLAHRAQQTLSR